MLWFCAVADSDKAKQEELLSRLLAMMNARDGQPVKRERPPTKLKSFDVDGIADFIKSDKCKRACSVS